MFLKYSLKNQKAFSLLEVLVSTFIFTIIVAAIAGILSRSLFSYRNARSFQENLQNAEYALNIMAKTLRTSSLSDKYSPKDDKILAFDYSQGKCFEYGINQANKYLYYKESESDVEKVEDCATASFFGENKMTNGNVIGKFEYKESDLNSMGVVAVSLEISSTNFRSKDKVRIQTVVSLRDYK